MSNTMHSRRSLSRAARERCAPPCDAKVTRPTFCTWRCVALCCRCCWQLQRNPAFTPKWSPGGPKMTPKWLQMDPGRPRRPPHRVPEVSGASPGAADGPRRAAAGSPGGVKGPSRSACGTFPGDCPRSIGCLPRRSRFLPCASPQKTPKRQTFLSQCHLAEVLDHM